MYITWISKRNKLFSVLEQPQSVDEVVAKVKAAASKPVKKRDQRPSSCLPGHGVLIEFCTDEKSNLGKAAESYDDATVIRVTEEEDSSSSVTLFQLNRVGDEVPRVSLHGSLPLNILVHMDIRESPSARPKVQAQVTQGKDGIEKTVGSIHEARSKSSGQRRTRILRVAETLCRLVVT